jgi:hypothetical protein
VAVLLRLSARPSSPPLGRQFRPGLLCTIWNRIGKTDALTNANKIMATMQGSIHVLATTFSSFAASIGLAFAPLVSGLATGLNSLLGSITHLPTWVKQAAGIFLVAGIAVSLVVLGIGLVMLLMALWVVAPVLLISFAVTLVAIVGGAFEYTLLIMALIHHGEILTWLGRIIGRLLSGLGTAIGNFFSLLGSTARDAIANLSNLVTSLLGRITAWFLSAVSTIGSWFDWMYRHNYYWHDLVIGIQLVVTGAISWVVGAWQSVTSFVVLAWVTLQVRAAQIWGAISSAITALGTLLLIDLHARWTAVTSFVLGTVGAIWSAAQGIGDALLQPVKGLGGWIAGAATNLVGAFVAGILSMVGAIGQAMGQIAGALVNFLGFHSPTREGPGATAHLWAPKLMEMFTSGIVAGTPLIAAASRRVAAVLNPADELSIARARRAARGMGLPAGGNVTLPVKIINLDGRVLLQAVQDDATSRLKMDGFSRVYR